MGKPVSSEISIPSPSTLTLHSQGLELGWVWTGFLVSGQAIPPLNKTPLTVCIFSRLRFFDSPPKNIKVYELWPMVVGVKRWAEIFRNTRIHVVTDNMQVLAMLNTGRSCNKTCMTWLRELFWICFIFNIDIHDSYIKSADNHLADALSRLAYDGVARKCSLL